ncbi:MAG: DUF2905 domain-containing protein [Pseudomonadota bacterium]
MQSSLAAWLILTGSMLLILGLAIKFGALSWLGNLPGDLHIKRENFQFYFPFTTMLVVSIAVTLVITFFRKFF